MLLLSIVLNANAQDEHLKLHFDFSQVDGTTVTDLASGVKGKLVGEAKVEQAGKFNVLNLGNSNGYFNMTSGAGLIVRKLQDYTVSACYFVDESASLSGNGYFLWTFSTSATCTQTGGKYMAYRLNAQRMATSTGGFGSESGIETGSESAKGKWIHVLYRQSGTAGELFIDGKRMGQNSSMPVLSSNFSTTPAYCWIGRPHFSGDSYLKKTLVADFRIYDTAVSDEQLSELASVAKAIDQEYKYGEPGDFTSLTAKVDECKAAISSGVSGYAPNAVAELQDEINIAEKEIAAGRASQMLINQYVESLSQKLSFMQSTSGYQP